MRKLTSLCIGEGPSQGSCCRRLLWLPAAVIQRAGGTETLSGRRNVGPPNGNRRRTGRRLNVSCCGVDGIAVGGCVLPPFPGFALP